MKTYNFEVRDLGDIDVGILPTVSTISINVEFELDADQLEITKLFLKDLFDSASMVEVLDDNDLAKESLEHAEMRDLELEEELIDNVRKLWRAM